MRKRLIISIALMTALILGGCSMMTVDQMYSPPKRSQMYNDLQLAIDGAMTDLSYCAPLAGEHQQPVQMADLDGNGVDECLLFAKSNKERPLRILVFQNENGAYRLTDTVECSGTAFDQVEYVQMDSKPGLEVVVGCQVSDQVLRSASVYTLAFGHIEQVVAVNYTKFLTVDMNGDNLSEMMVIRPGLMDSDNGIVELYSVRKGSAERSNEVSMSQPADKLKRIISGKLHDGNIAVYVASLVGDNALITDVYTIVDGMLTNVTLSNESGTSVLTLRNYYVYADDIDNDGVVELPCLLTMKPRSETYSDARHQLIRWYAMGSDGTEIDRMYTFHNFVGGWYIQLERDWASRLTVTNWSNQYTFYLWDEAYKTAEEIFTVYAFSGQDRDQQGISNDRFVLNRTESMVYSACLEEGAKKLDITRDDIIYSFRMIQKDWKTGET